MKRGRFAGAVVAVALVACTKSTGESASPPSAAASPPIVFASPSPTPSPSPVGCLDRGKSLDALESFRSDFVAAVSDRAFDNASAEAVERKRAEAAIRTLIALVAVDAGLETPAKALLADVILGLDTDPKKEYDEQEAFGRIPTDYAELKSLIEEDTSDPDC